MAGNRPVDGGLRRTVSGVGSPRRRRAVSDRRTATAGTRRRRMAVGQRAASAVGLRVTSGIELQQDYGDNMGDRFGNHGMLVYLAGVLYLVFRKDKKVTYLLPVEDGISDAQAEMNRSIYLLPREDIVSMQLPPRRNTSDLD
ncbi:hypothetical protein EJ110_NYTH18643 [Nymphaea thermarum]|nr:hypothetical protein EJ110_NYTH18643 [Nymphaea thermarum]